jgi:hypothetical protein
MTGVVRMNEPSIQVFCACNCEAKLSFPDGRGRLAELAVTQENTIFARPMAAAAEAQASTFSARASSRRALGRIVEEDVVGRDVEPAGRQEFLPRRWPTLPKPMRAGDVPWS